jgi:AraC-like DNA-binding protein
MIDGVEVLHARFVRHTFPRHSHESTTIALMDSGRATFYYRGERFVTGKGAVFLINAGAVHTGEPADRDGYRYRVLYLSVDALAPLLATDNRYTPRLLFQETVLNDATVVDLLHRLHHALSTDSSSMLAEELLLRLCRVLDRRYGDSPAQSERPKNAGTRTVMVARDFLESHPTERVSLRDLATVAAASPYRLSRMFSSEVGMPPHAYQTQLRIQLARRLLVTGASIATVAAQTGFCDQAHLSRAFKRYTGVTPKQFSRGARTG